MRCRENAVFIQKKALGFQTENKKNLCESIFFSGFYTLTSSVQPFREQQIIGLLVEQPTRQWTEPFKVSQISAPIGRWPMVRGCGGHLVSRLPMSTVDACRYNQAPCPVLCCHTCTLTHFCMIKAQTRPSTVALPVAGTFF